MNPPRTPQGPDSALRLAEEGFRGAFEEAPIGMALVSLEGRFVKVNQSLCDIVGYSEPELLALTFQEITHPDDLAADLAYVEQLLNGSLRTYQMDKRNLHRDGAVIWITLSVSLIRAADGTPLHFVSQIQDITAAKEVDASLRQAMAELQDAQRIARLGSWSWDPSARRSTWSEEMYRIFARDPQEGPALGSELLAYVIPDDRERVVAGFDDMLGAVGTYELDYRIVAGDGAERAVHVRGRRDPNRPGAYGGTVQDVTAPRAAERDLRAAEARFRSAFEHAPIGMGLADLGGHQLQVNDALCEITGYPSEELLATTLSAITHPEDIATDEELNGQLLRGEIEHLHRETRLLRASGEPVWVSLHATVLRDREGRPQHFLAQVVDITERRRLESQLRHLADHDPLTGLLNRRGLEAELERHVAHVNRYGDLGALLVLDLDHFKTVNDTLGHEAGDRLIVSVATLLSRRLRATDIVARLGGDEFAVLLPQADVQDAKRVAEAIVKDVRASTVVVGPQQPRHVTVSVGVTMFGQELASAEEALVNADLAMYDAKEAGRDRCALFSASRHDQPRMKARLAWIDRIRTALDNDLLTLYAQPIVELHSGQVQQHELLLRMLDASGDRIPPAAFLYIAERYDLIQELDRWVVTQAIALIERQPPGRKPTALEINISGRSLGDDGLLDRIEQELARSGVDPQRLIFEVTETAAIANIHFAREFAERLRGLGCRFALDDFGAGFGSFYYLKHIPFDYLKIDVEFVTGCLSNRTDQLVIESLVGIARGLNKQTIAEGVEDQATALFLRRGGVDFAQGYHVGRPVPVADALNADADLSLGGA